MQKGLHNLKNCSTPSFYELGKTFELSRDSCTLAAAKFAKFSLTVEAEHGFVL